MLDSDILNARLLETVPVYEGHKVLGGVVLYSTLGQGGMGAVYMGKHLRLNIDVAVKVMALPEDLPAGAIKKFELRFIREAQTAAAIDHQNLIRVIDVNTEHDVTFLIMQFVDGESVEELLERKSQMNETEAAKIVLGAAEGLGHAHETGIIHRDVKPANIMLDRRGNVKVADLGLAKAYGAAADRPDEPEQHTLTMAGQIMGTPPYMSPEHTYSARDVGPQADVWSLGVTLYKMLAGKLPFPESDIADLFQRIRKGPLPDIRLLRPNISDEIREIVYKAMERDLDRRYVDCNAMARALKKYLNDIAGGDTVLKIDLIDAPLSPKKTIPVPTLELCTQISDIIGHKQALHEAQGGPLNTDRKIPASPESSTDMYDDYHQFGEIPSHWERKLLIGGIVVAAVIIAAAALGRFVFSMF